MALFGGSRDASLIRSINRELINRFIDTEIAFYKLSLNDTKANMYDESDSKTYYSPMRINCLILKEDKTYTGDDAYDSTRLGEFAFLRSDIKDRNIIIEEGDVLEYDNEFYEIDGVGSSQYWTGRNPETDLGKEDRGEFGLSVAIKVTAHVTRRNRLNIQEVRSGINRPNNIPRNL
ncbi:hypothetical protein OAA41_00525 [bacterium]|jgi:hypothetical protein|nr:hypothetical protein [bacterium]